jgi:hypothetical protein
MKTLAFRKRELRTALQLVVTASHMALISNARPISARLPEGARRLGDSHGLILACYSLAQVGLRLTSVVERCLGFGVRHVRMAHTKAGSERADMGLHELLKKVAQLPQIIHAQACTVLDGIAQDSHGGNGSVPDRRGVGSFAVGDSGSFL